MKYYTIIFLFLSPITRSQTILFDSFGSPGDGNAELVGRTPDTTPGPNWTGAQFNWDTVNGTALYNGSFNAMAGVTLSNNYFQINPGMYELSLDLTLSGVGTNTSWIAIGFSETINTSSNRGYYQANSTNEGDPWLFLRENGDAEVRVGGSTTIGTSSGNNVIGSNLLLTLDSTQPSWVVTAAVDGVAIDLNGGSAGTAYEFSTTNPINVKSVGIGSASGISGNNTLDNFKLTLAPIPELSSLLLFLIPGLMLLFLRRKNIC